MSVGSKKYAPSSLLEIKFKTRRFPWRELTDTHGSVRGPFKREKIGRLAWPRPVPPRLDMRYELCVTNYERYIGSLYSR